MSVCLRFLGKGEKRGAREGEERRLCVSGVDVRLCKNKFGRNVPGARPGLLLMPRTHSAANVVSVVPTEECCM